MIAEFGHFVLILALTCAVLQATVPLWGAQTGHTGMMRVAEPAAPGRRRVLTALLIAA